MSTSPLRAGSIWALTALFASLFAVSTHAQAPDLARLKAAAAAQGKVALGQFELFKDTYLADVTIQTPNFSSDGSITGTTTLAGQDSRVVLQYVDSNEGSGRWILAFKLPTERIGDLAPAVHGSIADQLQLATPVMVFAKQGAQLASRDLAPEVRSFYQEVYGTQEFEVHIEDGVNLLASASAQADIQAGAATLGLDLQRFVLEGVILKNFDAEQLKEAKRNGKLLKAMGRESELRARLTGLEIKGLPQDFEMRNLALLVTGEPVVGLECYLTVGSGSDQRDFRCRSKFLLATQRNGGRQGVSISAQSDVDQPWKNALGIKGLEMRRLTMEIRYEKIKAAPPSVNIGLQGELKFGDKFVEVSGGMQSKAGVTVGFFKGSLNSLNRDDLVAVVNDMHAASTGKQGRAIDGRTLPDFELRQVEFNYAPLGGSTELGIESGIGLKGQLFLFGDKIAEMDVLADATQPLIRMKADVNQFEIGDIELQDCKLDVRLASEADSYFRFKGGARVLDIEATAEAELGVRTSIVKMSGKVANAFEADLLFSTPTLDNPRWEFEAAFKNDLSRTLGPAVAADLRRWAEKTQADFNAAQADLNQAQRDVNRINGDIAEVRGQVEAERREHKAALSRAQQDLQKLDNEISSMRRRVQSERNRHLDAIRTAERDVANLQQDIVTRRSEVTTQRSKDLSAHKSDVDRAKKSYDSAQSAFKKAEQAWKKEKNPLKKIKLGVTKDAKGVARDAKKVVYAAAKKKYDAARAALDRIPVDADPKIVALTAAKKTAGGVLEQARRAYQAATKGVSVDADPRVAGLLASKATAQAALGTTQKAFELAHKVPVDADPRLLGLVAARDTATAALDAAKLAVTVADDTVQAASEILAATAEGKVFVVESVQLRGKVDAYERGGKVELNARVRLLDKPEVLRLAVSAQQMERDDLVDLIADAVLPKLKAKR